MTRIRPAITVLFAAILTLLVVGLVPSVGAQDHKQNVCHRTGSSKNPWVGIQPSQNAKGHDKHPEKNGNNDKEGGSDFKKGPSVRGGGGGCEEGFDPEPGLVPEQKVTGGGAAPAAAIEGQPTVTG